MLLLLLALAFSGHALSPAWMNTADPPASRVAKLVAQMTLPEKVAMLHGFGAKLQSGYVGNVQGNSRLGIPGIRMEDGPQVRDPRAIRISIIQAIARGFVATESPRARKSALTARKGRPLHGHQG